MVLADVPSCSELPKSFVIHSIMAAADGLIQHTFKFIFLFVEKFTVIPID